jgi:hypothetical protein
MVEAYVVLIASSIGSFVSLFLLVDAIGDKWTISHTDPPREDLKEIAWYQIIDEAIRLVLQLAFLFIAAITVFSEHDGLRAIAFLVLITIPIILAVRSIYAWVRRKRLLSADPDKIRPKI